MSDKPTFELPDECLVSESKYLKRYEINGMPAEKFTIRAEQIHALAEAYAFWKYPEEPPDQWKKVPLDKVMHDAITSDFGGWDNPTWQETLWILSYAEMIRNADRGEWGPEGYGINCKPFREIIERLVTSKR